MPVLHDGFDHVYEGLARGHRDYGERVDIATDLIGSLLLRAMKERAPEGREDQYEGNDWSPSRAGQRESDRLWPNHPTIKDGLRYSGRSRIVSTSATVGTRAGVWSGGISIASDTPYVKYFTEGIPEGLGYGGVQPHRIPRHGTMKVDKGYPLAFHWERVGRDVWFWGWVNHPGIRLENIGGDFVKNAVDDIMDEARSICRRLVVINFFHELSESMGM